MKYLFNKYLKIDFTFFIKSSLIFIILVCVGTLTHEYGHIIFAKLLGYKTTLHFDRMNWYINGVDAETVAPPINNIIVTLGGILQTLLTGLIGFYLIHSKGKKVFWLGIYLTFFWSREIINLFGQIISAFVNKTDIFIGKSDEVILSNLLNLPSGFFSIVLGLIGLLICSYAVFFKIKDSLRLSFILSGLFGSIVGYYLWMIKFGPILLPL